MPQGRRSLAKHVAFLVLFAGFLAVNVPRISAGSPPASDWPQPRHNAGGTNANQVEGRFGPAEAADLELVADIRFPDILSGPPAVVDGDFVAYVRAGTHWTEDSGYRWRLTRLDGEMGDVVWAGGRQTCPHLPPHVTNGVVVAGANGCSQSDPSGQFGTAFDRSTGAGGWSVTYTPYVAVHEGRVFWALGPYGGYDDPERLVALDAVTGQRLWRRSLRNRGSLKAAASTLYMQIGSRIVARSVQDGTVLWRMAAPGGLDIATPDVLFFQTSTDVVAMSASSREILWQAPGRLDAVLDGQAFIGTPNGLVARSVASGALQWTNPDYLGAAIAADGVVYSHDSERRTIVAIRASDGAFLDSVIGGIPAVASGRLYVTTGRVVRSYG